MSPSPEPFAAIVPIRSWTTGKSRLDVDDDARESLGRAFALDVVSALHDSPRIGVVVVVSSDAEVRTTFASCEAVDDRGRGLDDAVAQGCAHAVAGGWSRIVVVPSDLPCISVAALDEVLAMSEGHTHTYCPDADGDGSSLVISHDPATLVTSYGRGSASAHRSAGLVPLLGAPLEVRRDVDTLEHLREAQGLGTGRHTTAVLTESQRPDDTSTMTSRPCARARASRRWRSSPAVTRFAGSVSMR